MIILVYPFIFTGEELRPDYGFPHAEWRRNPQASGIKTNIDNIEAADSKKKYLVRWRSLHNSDKEEETGNSLQTIWT